MEIPCEFGIEPPGSISHGVSLARYLQNCTFPNSEMSILFTDEAKFSHDSIINHHNNHLWSYENPYGIIESRHQHKFSCKVRAGIIGDFLFGPLFLPPILTGDNYTQFLETQLPINIIRRHSSTDMQSNVVHARWSSSTFQPHCSRVSE